MAPAKVQLKLIQNLVNRRVTFSKRKMGLLKKASELSLLSDAEVALIIFSSTGKLFEFASPSMNRIVGRYQIFSMSTDQQTQLPKNIETLRWEAEDLQKRMAHLERANKCMIGEDLNSMSLTQLQHLEKKMTLGAKRIHSRQDKILIECIRSLKPKAQSLKAENADLGKKIGQSDKEREINIDINGEVSDTMEAYAATQQDLPKN